MNAIMKSWQYLSTVRISYNMYETSLERLVLE